MSPRGGCRTSETNKGKFLIKVGNVNIWVHRWEEGECESALIDGKERRAGL